jgi:phthiocerol/phenolphthiocerol synthesis type-I polyketide synthase E
MHEKIENRSESNGVAIIGMAGRFPGAKNIREFWKNLEEGVECIGFYSDQELIEAGADPEVLKNPQYVKAKGEVADVDMFDAAFFGINPREAEVTDPQHRMLLECAWEALEHAGYDSSKYHDRIGVYAGKSMDYYLLLNVFPHIKKEISAGSLQAAVGNDKDSLTTTISYRLDLTGPAITIQTSSSTSLVAVCVACQGLLTYQCDIALAGGITAGPPIRSGYKYEEGNIWSPDGHCRAYDAMAKGFVPGSGMGLVVLKRLEDAEADGDTIWAVIKGFAVNNDGAKKVSYHAPSVDAQAEVVAEALAVADVHPETIQYIEGHGTGTPLGDPIELTALTQVFQAYTDKKQFCALCSVKSNIGHLDTAAGIAGLIKVALSLNYRKIPANLHFKISNPTVDFANSPFFVNRETREWKSQGMPRRAGVTSLGMGGTNAHVIVEESPAQEATRESRPYQLLLLSARSDSALENITGNLVDYLKEHKNINLADAAYTLALGRRDLNFRRTILCQPAEDAEVKLDRLTPGWRFDGSSERVDRPVVFMFSGQGAQYVNMGKGLYLHEIVFRENMDKCAQLLAPQLGIDVLELVYPPSEADAAEYSEKLKETRLTQPVLFMLEYSLARLWMAWGIEPVGMIGHSIGEYTAACISGCISLEDALRLVAERGRLMQECETGAMLSVELSEAEIKKMIGIELSLAAVNSPKHCVVSGKPGAVEKLEQELKARGVYCRQLHTSHAFHSEMMDPVKNKFLDGLKNVKFNAPGIPFISCVTGTWIRSGEVCSDRYWATQLREPVRFSQGIQEILKDPSRLLLELGPGNNLCLLARQHKENATEEGIFSSIRHVRQTDPDLVFILKNLSGIWLAGGQVDWQGYYRQEKRRRIPLPTYPFERKRFWMEGVKVSSTAAEPDKIRERESPPGEDEKVPANKQAGTGEEKTFQPRPRLNNAYVAPSNDTEKDIVSIWEDILGIRPIGIEDNFFDLGGHSLLATVFLSHLQEKFHVRLEMGAIFESPTVSAVANLVKTKESDKTDVSAEVENLIQEIERLSPDEIQTALVEEKPE